MDKQRKEWQKVLREAQIYVDRALSTVKHGGVMLPLPTDIREPIAVKVLTLMPARS